MTKLVLRYFMSSTTGTSSLPCHSFDSCMGMNSMLKALYVPDLSSFQTLRQRGCCRRRVEVTKENELVDAMNDFDIVISVLPFSYDINVTRACIRAHVNGIDVSSARDDDERGSEGITYVMGCGATPGVTNVLARRGFA
jgi:saccharopine dehydrogenase-like NADP-dependent oxidoreductase